jgi:hypothetical protein
VSIGGIAATPTCTSGAWSTGPVNVTALAQGSVSITASHTDAAGNSATASTTTTKDTSAPTLTIGTLAAINNGNVTGYSFAATCETGGGAVSFSLTSGATVSGSGPCSAGAYTAGPVNASSLTDGPVSVSVTQADALGNSATATASTTKDTVNPTVAITAPATITSANQATYSVAGTCSENTRTVSVSIGGIAATPTCTSLAWNTGPVNVTALAQGSVTITATHTDAAGNSATATASTNKDTIAPALTIATLTPINIGNVAAYSFTGACETGGSAVSFSVTAGATLSGTATCTAGAYAVSRNASTLTDGPVSVSVTQSDVWGNSATATGTTVKDTVVAAPVITAPVGGSIVDANPTISGTGETGATVTVRRSALTVCTATVSAGAWTCASTLTPATYTITATQTDAAGNTSAPSAGVTFTVALPQTITFSALPGTTFGVAPFTVTATASSGLPVSFSSLSTGVCTVSGNTVTIVGVGVCTIAADQAGDATYRAAARVTNSLTVVQQTQTITFNVLFDKLATAPPFTVSATASSGLAVSFSSLTTPVCTVSGNLVTLVNAGTCSIAADQAGSSNIAPAPRVTQSFLVLCDVNAPGDCDNDGIPNAVEFQENTNPYLKDNDVFGNARLFAMQQYRDFLNREGDAASLQIWTSLVAGGSLTRAQAIDGFLSSPEFAGMVAPVVRLYFATFLRIPDYDGLTFNAGLVRAGTVTLTQLADFFTASPEFMARYGSLNNTQFVTLLYSNVLGRAPDTAGLNGWVNLLNTGYTRGQVLLGFSDSPENQAAMANEVFVTMMYAGMLRRTPDPAGFSAWVSGLDAGTYTRTQVINGFFLSTEYHNRFLP